MNNAKKTQVRPSAFKILGRIFSYIWKNFPKRFIVVLIAIIVSGVVAAINTMFIQVLVDHYIDPMVANPTLVDSLMKELSIVIIIIACMYFIGVVAMYIYTRLMAVISQGTLKAIREVTSDELQALAQKYFCKENLIAVVAGKKV